MQRLTLEAIRNFNLGSSDIIECCIHPNSQIIGGQPQGSLVIKLSDEIVVKFGAGVSVEEADNQRKAYELLDGGVVRVPRVVRYFTRTFDHTSLPIGYLVMEYIYGDILELLGSHLVDQIVKILSHFSTIRSLRPGLLQTGVSRGLLWDSNGKPTFKIIKEMEH